MSNFVSEHGRQLVLIIQQRQQPCVDVDRSVRKCKSIRNRISQCAKLPFDVLEFLVSDNGHSDAREISVQSGIVVDRAFFFEPLVEQFDFAKKLLVDFAKAELLVANLLLRRGLRCCSALGARGYWQRRKNQGERKQGDLKIFFGVHGST
jgi:hypothetical protein